MSEVSGANSSQDLRPDPEAVARLAKAIEQIESGDPPADLAQRREEHKLEEQARQIVLRKLSAQGRTRAELADALADKEIPSDVAERVLDRMTDVGLVDDSTFARDWVASRQQRKHLSRRKLSDELRQKGVDPGLISEAVASVGEDDEYEAAVELAERKLQSLARHDLTTQRRRLAGLLERRGFSVGLIHRVLADVLEPHR